MSKMDDAIRLIRIKTWDEMLKVGELDEDGDIELDRNHTEDRNPYFVFGMKKLCGRVYHISLDNEFTFGGPKPTNFWKLFDGVENWSISDEMIECEYHPETHPEYFI